MDFDDPRQRAIFFEVHEDLPREGPGNAESGARALALAGPLPDAARILDIGCGPGLQTLELAERVPEARILAVDNHPPYLAELARRAAKRGLSDRIETRRGDMAALDIPAGRFDLIWCEGAAYILGFPEALDAWRPLLALEGRMALTEPVWLRGDPPAEVRAFWEAYPAMRDVEACRAIVSEKGYQLLGDFVLPEAAWWDHYYTPIEARVGVLRSKYSNDPVAEIVLRECEEEVEFYRKYSRYYGYCFLVLASPTG